MLLRLHAVTIGFVILLCGALAFVNLNPRLQWWHLSWYCSWDQYEHGWPFTYMSRERNRDGDMGGLAYGPWPFFDDPPLRQFSPMWLVVDIVVALCLLALTSRAVESWFGVRQVRPQFRLASLLQVIAFACVLLALIRVRKATSAGLTSPVSLSFWFQMPRCSFSLVFQAFFSSS